jgi:hypothetical protein
MDAGGDAERLLLSLPPTYPRVPHLVGGSGTRDDLLLTAAEAATLLNRPLVVEEKLDGANVALWLRQGELEVGLRSGADGLDRGRQLGPLRAWAAQWSDHLRTLLFGGVVLYAEWLYLRHTVAYNRLPSYLVGLDLYEAGAGFLAPAERNRRLAEASVARPPELFRGGSATLAELRRLDDCSRFGDQPMEGLVVRSLDGAEPRLAKLLRPGFNRLGDEEWLVGRPRNRLARSDSSWQ